MRDLPFYALVALDGLIMDVSLVFTLQTLELASLLVQ